MSADESGYQPIEFAGALSAYSRRTDSQLVAACLRNNTTAWQALIERYQRLIYSVALKRGLSQTDSEDVFQNVCLKLYERLGDLRNTESLASYIASVTVRECSQIYRKERNNHLLSDSVEDADIEDRYISFFANPAETPEDAVLGATLRYEIQQAMLELSPDCRKLLTLLFEHDVATYQSVAEMLNTPVGSIGPRRSRCLERLKVILDRRMKLQ